MWPFRRRCEGLSVLPALRDAERPGSSVWPVTVPLHRIVGTVARCCDFDRCFRPLRRHLDRRLADVRSSFRDRPLPAVRLHQGDDGYYVVDGHHRIALARERGMLEIDGIVTCHC